MPIGAHVVGESGLHGRLTDQVQTDDGTSFAIVTFDNGTSVRIPSAMLVMQANGNAYVPLRQADLPQAGAISSTEEIVVPVIVEDVQVSKRTVETGRVRLRKLVHERDELVDEPLLREEVAVNRVAVNRQINTLPEVRHEGNTLIVPVVEEVLVVEKRLILREELHITRQQTTAREPQTVTLRSEELIVERLPPEGAGEADRVEIPDPS